VVVKAIRSIPAWLGLVAVACYAAAEAWIWVDDYLSRKRFPPGWIADSNIPIGAQALAIGG
jgi:hypothetical protein